MRNEKRSGWSVLVFCLYLIATALPLYLVSKDILERYGPIWLIPLFIFVLVVGIVAYKKVPTSILGRFIRKEPLVIDRSGETPYQFDNPYTAKKSQ